MEDFFEKFKSFNVLIIGDVMVDSYVWGQVDRISPEAPVPVVRVSKTEDRLGGAANVALNVQSLGSNPIICAVIGNDKEGTEFLDLLDSKQLTKEGLITVQDRPTTKKTRIIAHNQQILRVDAESDDPISSQTTQLVLERITKIISTKNIDIIIFEDYDKGLITEELIQPVVRLANENGILTVVDPKKRNFHFYKDVTLFKPNLKELKEGLKVNLDAKDKDQIEAAVRSLKIELNARIVMLTLSESGVYIDSENGQRSVPAHVRNIADVSGAGDTVIASVALCLASGMDEFKAASVANIAGGLVCEYVGVVPIERSQLLEEAKYLLQDGVD